MTPNWIKNPDAMPTPREIETVAMVLEGQHGNWAAAISDFFADCHEQRGDVGRCWAWIGVAALVRERQQKRDTEAVEPLL